MSHSSCSFNSSNVFEYGNYKTTLLSIKAKEDGFCSRRCSSTTDSVSPPKPVLVGMPETSEGGEFPVLILLHGFMTPNDFYSQLIRHVASYGFIVVAPQLYSIATTDATGDVEAAAAITDWLSNRSLQSFLPSNICPIVTKLALSGHSRGGKVAFALALSKTEPFSALIGIDPVDGTTFSQTPPPVLTGVPSSFQLGGIPVMVIGSGLGAEKKNRFSCACAPKGVNHEAFYKECQSPACYFVAKDYGHMDMLDDDTKGMIGKMTYAMCKNGESREPMRKFVGGVLVAFLKAYLEGDDADLVAIRNGEVELPVQLDAVDFRLSVPA